VDLKPFYTNNGTRQRTDPRPSTQERLSGRVLRSAEGAEGARGAEEDQGVLQKRKGHLDLRDGNDRAVVLGTTGQIPTPSLRRSPHSRMDQELNIYLLKNFIKKRGVFIYLTIFLIEILLYLMQKRSLIIPY